MILPPTVFAAKSSNNGNQGHSQKNGVNHNSEYHSNADGERPGYGYGDNNHNHLGPPGKSGEQRPGYGYGDGNHDHIGPPGK